MKASSPSLLQRNANPSKSVSKFKKSAFATTGFLDQFRWPLEQVQRSYCNSAADLSVIGWHMLSTHGC